MPWSKGTVLTGQLHGTGVVRVGDLLVCNGRPCEIVGIEQLRARLREAASGDVVGLALGISVPSEGFRGKTVVFRPRPGAGPPALTEDGEVVPNVNVLVQWGAKEGRTTALGVCSFDGLTVTLHDKEDALVMTAPGGQLTVRASVSAFMSADPMTPRASLSGRNQGGRNRRGSGG